MIAKPSSPGTPPHLVWKVQILTLFPEMFPGPLGYSLAGKALHSGLWELETVDIRRFARDKHASVDDRPFGGGAGMVMRPDVLDAALTCVLGSQPSPDKTGQRGAKPVLCLSPRGRLLTQERITELASGPGMIIVCGRYEGIDARIIEARDMEEISIGDYILSGGEPAALAMIDACVRLQPGIIGKEDSLCEESFHNHLLEYPHYTQPRHWSGYEVPEVLLSGHHEKIAAWRKQQAEMITRKRRPDLWQLYQNQPYGQNHRYGTKTQKERSKG